MLFIFIFKSRAKTHFAPLGLRVGLEMIYTHSVPLGLPL